MKKGQLLQRLEEVASREEKPGGIQNYFILGIGIAAVMLHTLL
ncbi:hypothetical protein KP77_14670 [Jeotgalibacillus alimentarius]|uniref:Uncharacterized protein n=1 Tax=Jeotgalibacillus alimentarius TaxID=135826 RepID=A0A0C2VMH4_9BACL|nr:hypothetical protein [Jeotgalibacillus alimentarius]KIL50092.1 hypothetical protein KP77_14670 [Jeotgalibacillus alimentarius]